MKARIEPTQENFDIVVEEANLPLLYYWKQKYGFTVDEFSAVRSNNLEILQLVTHWTEYWGYERYYPLMEEVASAKNMYLVRSFSIVGVPAEFVKAGWIEAVAYLLEQNARGLELYIDAIIDAINYKQWEILRLLLNYLDTNERQELEDDVISKVYDINHSPEADRILDEYGISTSF
jgi:hypothetical protein